MKTHQNPLSDHFERLKELVPELYSKDFESQNTRTGALYDLMKRTLRIIEAVYVEDPSAIHQTSLEEYGKVIAELKQLGYQYEGHQALIEKATNQLILKAKKPMIKAKGQSKKGSSEDRKAM